LPINVLEAIASRGERKWVRWRMDREPECCWDRLVFSIKEAVHKALPPHVRGTLGFHDGRVEIDPASKGFSVQLNSPGSGTSGPKGSAIEGKWLHSDGLIGAAVAISKADRPEFASAGGGWMRVKSDPKTSIVSTVAFCPKTPY
jgi:4'-phosphopantetheinyl transferase EntD